MWLIGEVTLAGYLRPAATGQARHVYIRQLQFVFVAMAVGVPMSFEQRFEGTLHLSDVL
jgi:hypothetical protein